jgi:hypothetical protein
MDSTPPKINSTNLRLAAVCLAGVVLTAGVVVFLFNPATSRFYPVCQFHLVTGLNCPGCGMTRALYALLHGDILIALRDNALFIGLLLLLALRGGSFALNKIRGRRNGDFIPRNIPWLLLLFALVFTVLRNLPAFAFLSPATT